MNFIFEIMGGDKIVFFNNKKNVKVDSLQHNFSLQQLSIIIILMLHSCLYEGLIDKAMCYLCI